MATIFLHRMVDADGNSVGGSDAPMSVSDTTRSNRPTFYAEAVGVAPGNNKSMLSVVNTSSTKLLRIREVYVKNVATSSVNGTVLSFQLKRIAGHSSGTSITPEVSDTSDSLDGGVTVKTGSTVSSESINAIKRWMVSSEEWGNGALDFENMQALEMGLYPIYEAHSPQKPITLRQNQGVTIKCATNSSAGTFDVAIVFTQEDV